MEEIRIDLTKQTPEEIEKDRRVMQLLFRLNHTMPLTDEYDALLHELFPFLGEGAVINAPLTVVRPYNVKIGKNSIIMNGCLMMAAGGITIEDNVQIAANAQLISNNHDLENRMIITCKPVIIRRRAWIGAGATILPGVEIGENSVIGAASVVTRSVPANSIAVGNPARIIREI